MNLLNRKPKLLIVDDNPEILQVTYEMLDQTVFHLMKAHSGKECLNLVRLEKPDIILMDVVMPDLNGIEVCREIKNDPVIAETGIILMTGKMTGTEDIVSGLEEGADDYISRPFSKRELIARVNSCLRLYRLNSSNRQLEIKYKQLIDLSRDGIITLDLEGNITTHNAYALNLFRTDSLQLTGSSIRSYIHPDSAEIWEKFHKLLKSNITPPFITISLRIEEKTIKAEVISSPLFDGVRVTGALCIIRDTLPARDKINAGSFRGIQNSEKREEEFLDMLSAMPSKQTAEIYGNRLIKDEYPEIFQRMVSQYSDIIRVMVDNRIYKVQDSPKNKLTGLSGELGFLKATPRDVIIIHKEAIKVMTDSTPSKKTNLIKEEGRIALIELMGYLVSYYRNLNS